MDTLLPFALLCFTSFFTLTNFLGTMPVFLTMTKGMGDDERCHIVKRATSLSSLFWLLLSQVNSYLNFSVYLPIISELLPVSLF